MNRLVERRLVAPRSAPHHPYREAAAAPETAGTVDGTAPSPAALAPAAGPTFEESARRVRARRRMVLEIAVGILLIVATLLRPVVF